MMKCKPHNTIVWSAALAGLMVGFTSPAALAHGNNPRQGRDTSAHVSGRPSDSWRYIDTMDLNLLFDPGLNSALGEGSPPPVEPDPGDYLLEVVTQPSLTAPPQAPSGDEPFPQIENPLGFTPSQGPVVVTAPIGGAVPAPGTLALLGLAAAAVGAGRRRRRRV